MTSQVVQTPTWLGPASSPTRSKRKRGKNTKTEEAFPYGYRWREVRGVDGANRYEQVALSREDFLNPQVDDVMPQGNWHDQFLGPLVALIRFRMKALGKYVFHDVIMRFKIPGVSNPAPDVAVVDTRHVSDEKIESWDASDSARRPFFVAEALSPSTKDMDLDDKKKDYAKAGVKEYFVFNILKDPVEILAFRLLKTRPAYRKAKPDRRGRFVAKTLGLAFRVDESRPLGIVVEDVATGEVLLTLEEKVEALGQENEVLKTNLEAEAAAREAAEARAARHERRAEQETRRAAELEAKLRALGLEP